VKNKSEKKINNISDGRSNQCGFRLHTLSEFNIHIAAAPYSQGTGHQLFKDIALTA
jgi:hypothetical protein